MGHTNYWKRLKVLPAKNFAAAANDCATVMPHLGVPLAGPNGTGSRVYRADLIAFNGQAEAGCESFVVDRVVTGRGGEPGAFAFCKTNQRPYDVCVRVALIVLKHHLGAAITVSSDGGDAEWQRARMECQKWLGYGNDFRLEE